MDAIFGFRTLDGTYVTGRSKDEGNNRVVKVQGILRVVPLERREEPMRWLTPEQKTRIESAEFYELLQREVARRFPQHSAR